MSYEDLTAKKSELDKLLPFSAEVQKNLRKEVQLSLSCVEGSFDGSTLSRKDTAMILYQDKTVDGHPLTEHIRSLNLAKAFELVEELAEQTSQPVDDADVKNIHRVVVRELDDKNGGVYRGTSLRFEEGAEELPEPAKVGRMMNDFGMWLFTARTLHPVVLAAEAHFRLMSIQPFTSGNAATARMLMNLILLRHGYPPAMYTRREKKEYWSSLERAIFQNDRSEYDRLIHRVVNRALDAYIKFGKQIQVENDESEPYFLRIGQLAKETGERVSTIRYWTSLGLLETAGKTSADYTLYSSEILPKVKRIKELKEQRYTLDEIREQVHKD